MLRTLLCLCSVYLCLALTSRGEAANGLTVAGGPGGRLHLTAGEEEVCTFMPLMADGTWTFFRAKAAGEVVAGAYPFVLPMGAGSMAGGLVVAASGGSVAASWSLVAQDAITFQTLAVATDFDVPILAGGRWEADGRSGLFPAEFGGAHVFIGEVRRLVITPLTGPVLAFSFPKPTMVLLQDNRQWGTATFSLRIGRGAGRMAAAEENSIAITVEGAQYSPTLPAALQPVVLQADEQWIPLREELEIVPGSALDLSGAGFVDGPCGSNGRVIVSPDGHFVYAGEPDQPKRFYGVNFCFSAQFLPKDKVDRLLDRLMRLGYNTVRIHHYESELTTPEGQPGFDWDPKKVDQLDYFLAGCAKRGLWVTTDVYVSRPVSGAQIGLADKEIPMDRFKLLVPVYEPAFQDWVAFARKFLDRINPYTGLRLADDPAIAWLSLINEGPISNNWSQIRQMPEWQAAWAVWLVYRYPAREDLMAALGDLVDTSDPARLSVTMPEGLSGNSVPSRLASVFVADLEKATFERMRNFLRKELKCEALLTNMNNAGPSVVPLQLARESFDYVDEHFYVDHPNFLEKPWRLPSFSSNANPVAAGATGGLNVATVRLFGKPFTITEYNYSGPGRFRGVGGILTGALGALQDWDAMWRFAYSHSDGNLFEPGRMGYFDLVSDPLNQAADRLTLFLYLRRDLAVAPTRIAAVLPEADLRNPPDGLGVSSLRSAAWITRIGSLITRPGGDVPPGFLAIPPVPGKVALTAAMAKIEDPKRPAGVLRSETGEITIDAPQAVFVIDAPKSAGGYADAGKSLSAPTAGVEVDEITTGATVFVNSLDASPLRSSRRLLVTHLTDLQNTGVRYGEGARQTLLDWGGLPHLVRDGAARVSLQMDGAEAFTVWALSVGGRRTEKIASKVENGRLIFTVSVKGSEGARMLYEIAPEGGN